MSHTVEILSVGTELLLGNIANTDAQILSQGLSELGLNVFWHTVVGDNLQRAEEAVRQTGGYFLNYFDNDLNAEFHRRITGPNIARATGGALDAIVVGVGSGGTISGVGEYIKAWYPDVKIIAVEPYESQAIGGGYVGRHSIPGLGAGFVPENYNPHIVDAVMAVPSKTANVTAREVLETDAVPASPSAGAVLAAAHQLMAEHPEQQRVVCVFAGQVFYE